MCLPEEIEICDRFDDSRRGFESGFEGSRSDERVAGYETYGAEIANDRAVDGECRQRWFQRMPWLRNELACLRWMDGWQFYVSSSAWERRAKNALCNKQE